MSITVVPTAIPDVKIITPKRFEDARGFFVETWNAERFAAVADANFVQDNSSLSRPVGTVRGLHFQLPPFAQNKLVRVLRGCIFDVAVDIRRSSPTFGRHVAVELSADNGRQLWIPIGFAHGFATLEPDTEIAYKVTGCYDAASEGGVLWNDSALGIVWPVSADKAVLSEKDTTLRRLADAPRLFD